MKRILFIVLAFIGLSMGTANAQSCCTTKKENCKPKVCCPTTPTCCKGDESNTSKEKTKKEISKTKNDE